MNKRAEAVICSAVFAETSPPHQWFLAFLISPRQCVMADLHRSHSSPAMVQSGLFNNSGGNLSYGGSLWLHICSWGEGINSFASAETVRDSKKKKIWMRKIKSPRRYFTDKPFYLSSYLRLERGSWGIIALPDNVDFRLHLHPSLVFTKTDVRFYKNHPFTQTGRNTAGVISNKNSGRTWRGGTFKCHRPAAVKGSVVRFLAQTVWTLKLLPPPPRRWVKHGGQIVRSFSSSSMRPDFSGVVVFLCKLYWHLRSLFIDFLELNTGVFGICSISPLGELIIWTLTAYYSITQRIMWIQFKHFFLSKAIVFQESRNQL